jgi:hypothetical protein
MELKLHEKLIFTKDDLLNTILAVNESQMRFLFRVILDAEAGNRAVKDPNFIKNIQGFMENNKVEAAYFTAVNGSRNSIFILDIPSTDMMPVIAEPFFQMGASVEFFPTMNLEDLKKGLSAAIK